MADNDAPAVTRVLIVEDDTVFRVPLRAALASQGYAVVAVDSAEAAETVLDHEAIDVILSDLGLPGMDGATLAARHAPRAALPPSVVGHLVKPFDVPRLLSMLGEAVKARGRDP